MELRRAYIRNYSLRYGPQQVWDFIILSCESCGLPFLVLGCNNSSVLTWKKSLLKMMFYNLTRMDVMEWEVKTAVIAELDLNQRFTWLLGE